MTPTRCILVHRRRREPAEPIEAPDGTITLAKGGEAVWDHLRAVSGAHDGALLCEGHLARLRLDLDAIAAVALYCRAMIAPGGSAGPAAGRSGGIDAPTPIALSPVDDADDATAWLWSWCSMVAEESGHDLPRNRLWTVAGVVHGLGANPVIMLRTLTTWLQDRLDWAAEQPWVDELVGEAKSKARQLDSRYPREEQPRHLPMPCPACDRLTLTRHPPRFHCGPVVIVCDDEKCGEVIDERMFDWHTRRLTEERA